MKTRVLIAGGGVAALETLLALHALAGDRVEITLLAPELKFVNRSMSTEQPFKPQRVRGIQLRQVAADFHARWERDVLDRVDSTRRCAITGAHERLRYDKLVLATGAHVDPDYSSAFTYRDGQDGPGYRFLLKQLAQGDASRLVFVKPPGSSWPLPLYDLALMTASHCAARGRSDIELLLLTPEEEPLAVFGRSVSAAVRDLLERVGVALHTNSYARPAREGWLDVVPGHRRIRAERIVTQPRLVGRRIRGVPFDCDAFVPVDLHGRVRGLEDVYAAGDVTNFPVKQGGLAAQQADAVAAAIAASAGADLAPEPYRLVLRGILLTGGAPRYLRSDISGRSGDDSVISKHPLWWPPDKLAGRYLAPYISRQSGSALDVHMPPGDHPAPVRADTRGSYGSVPVRAPTLTLDSGDAALRESPRR